MLKIRLNIVEPYCSSIKNPSNFHKFCTEVSSNHYLFKMHSILILIMFYFLNVLNACNALCCIYLYTDKCFHMFSKCNVATKLQYIQFHAQLATPNPIVDVVARLKIDLHGNGV
jgi:hypothetical protein